MSTVHVDPGTPFGEAVRGRGVVQLDRSKWDYRHQILAQKKALTPDSEHPTRA